MTSTTARLIAVLAFVLLLAWGMQDARAQSSPPAPGAVFTVPADLPNPAPPLPSCWPDRIGGTGVGFVSGPFEGPVEGSTLKGQYVGWWCESEPKGAGNWRMSAIWGGLNYAVIHPDIPFGSTMAQIAAAYWAANIKAVPDPALDQWRINMNAAVVTALARTRPATPPVSVGWVTAARSTYNTVGGKISTFKGLTTLGLECYCATPIVVGTVTYCPFAGAAPSVVASCKKAP